jgi:hypothetical protein
MKMDLLTEDFRSMGPARWLVGAGVAGAVLVGAWIVVHALIYAPQARAMVERQNAEEIARDNLAFCGKLGMAPGMQAFITCADDTRTSARRRSYNGSARITGNYVFSSLALQAKGPSDRTTLALLVEASQCGCGLRA